ncbi:RNA-DIRECTED DNA METHYLATION 1 [Wolffia australiana]
MAGKWEDGVCNLISDTSSSDSSEIKSPVGKKPRIEININHQDRTTISKGTEMIELTKRAEMYQEFMSQITIPRRRGSIIPFTSWQGLGNSMKQLHGQPLHYMTNLQLRQWDEQRLGAENSERLDLVFHPAKAEALVWASEEVHRLTCNPSELARVWASDSMHYSLVDSIIPEFPI